MNNYLVGPRLERRYVFFPNTCFLNTIIPTMTLSQTAISQMDYTTSPRSGPQETPFGSGIHHKASRESDVLDNFIVQIGVGQETCIQDKDIDPLMKLANEENDICNRTTFSCVTKLIPLIYNISWFIHII